MTERWTIELLGGLRLRQGDQEITRFRTQKTALLLAYLAMHRLRSHPRDQLIELLWPDSDLEAGRTNLSVALNALRRQMEPPGVPAGSVLVADRSQVRLHPAACATDVEEFDRAVRAAESAKEPQPRIALWIAAIEVYRGDLLPTFYEDWILPERDRLRNAYLVALRSIVRECAEARQFDRAIAYAHRIIRADPLREEPYRNLMRLYRAVGHPEEALRQYQELTRLLEKELQTAPSAATRELAQEISQTSARRPPRESRPAADLPRTEPPRPDPHPPAHLPMQFTRFYGREEEMTRLAALLHGSSEKAKSHRARIYTLTGPGGTGKTRLSIEVGRQVTGAFAGGVWFVPLDKLRDPLLLGEALRDALRLPRQIQPAALDQVIAYLNGRAQPCLLILDNFEQITDGGAPVVWTLVNRVPLLQCLVTSRSPLSLPGENEIPLLPLPLPDMESLAPSSSASLPSPAQLMTCPSVVLFVDRAQAARPDFQITPRNAGTIADLCQTLEGLPLAIELAAARARALTPAQMLERLSERFELLESRRADRAERHRSLWGAIEWSYRLLPPDLQRFFARLSVFRGSWSLEAAEGVCEELAALECLTQLRGHSLISAEESSSAIRFRMLASIREYAREQLTPEERAETERRRALFFQRWVTGAQLSGSEQLIWYERFEEDLDNLRAVLDWSLQENNDVEIGHQIAGSLLVFWRVRGHLPEGRQWYERLLKRAGNIPTRGLARTLYCASALASLTGDFQTARPYLERCREMAQALGDENLLSTVFNEMGAIAFRLGDYELARSHFERFLELGRKHGLAGRVASALTNLASVEQMRGNYPESHALHAQSLQAWREAGDRLGEARTHYNLALLACTEGEWEKARASFQTSLDIRRALGDYHGVTIALIGIGRASYHLKEYAASVAHIRESLEMARGQNARMSLTDILQLMTELVSALGEREMSARMSGALEKIREEMNFPMPPPDRARYEIVQANLRAALGEEACEALRAQGRALSMEQALAALEETLAGKSV